MDDRRQRRDAAVVFIVALALGLLGASYIAADGDGLKETGLALATGPGWRAYHLFHTWLNQQALWLAWRLPGPSFVPLQLLNTLLGAAAAVLLLKLFQRVGLSRRVALAGVGVWLLSATPWIHTRTAETGITPLPFLLGAWLLLLSPGRPRAVSRAALAGVLLALATLLSINYLVLVPSCLVCLPWLTTDRSERWRAGAAFSGAFVVATGVPYLFVAARLGLDPASFVHWMLHHEDSKGLAGGGLVLRLLRMGSGLGRLFFPVTAGETALKELLRGREVAVTLGDWLALLRNLLGTLALVGLFLKGCRDNLRTELLPGIVAVGVTALFALIWLGSEPQYWLPVYPWLLAGAALGAGRLARPWVGSALLLVLLVSNAPSSLPTPLSPGWGTDWQLAQRAAAELDGPTLVIVPGNTPLRLLDELRDDVGILDLTYSVPEDKEGGAFFNWVSIPVDAMLSGGDRVILEGLADPPPAHLIGRWDMVRGTHQVSRDEFAAWVREHYSLVPFGDLPGIFEVTPPRHPKP